MLGLSGEDAKANTAYVQIGSLAGRAASLPADLLRSRRIRITGSGVGSQSARPCSDTGFVLAQNRLARLLHGDLVSSGRGIRSSMTWRWFTKPDIRAGVPADDQGEHSRVVVADLRAAWGRRRADVDMRELVDGLIAASDEFAELWSLHEVAVQPMQRKTFQTRVGAITLDCAVLANVHGQQLVVLTPPPASSAMEALQLLATLGEQTIRADDAALDSVRARDEGVARG